MGTLINGLLFAEDLERFESRIDPCTAIFVARLVKGKGIWLALEAAKIIARHEPKFRLIVVGNGIELTKAKSWVAANGLTESIKFAGYQADVTPYYEEADFVWIPTDPKIMREGMPLVALEAQAHALPSLFSNSGGLPETQIEGETGICIDPYTPEKLVSISTSLMNDTQKYNFMREKIRDHRKVWSIDKMIQAYTESYVRELMLST
ncbi:MAG: glycosyltransferase family 4 protein [Gammaproteobacteria bacterium]|nr:glycosyltransferase family 4 protein [Gammaproteobacteria bacterium]